MFVLCENINLTRHKNIHIDEARETNKMQLIQCLLSNFYLNMFQASLCPSSGKQDCVLLHMVFCTGCAGCGCVELGCKLFALCEGYCLAQLSQTVTFTQCKQLTTQLHTTTASTTSAEHHAVVHGLVFLMMGIMMPETCWDISLIINIGLVTSCWFLSLHPMFTMLGYKNLKFTLMFTVLSVLAKDLTDFIVLFQFKA